MLKSPGEAHSLLLLQMENVTCLCPSIRFFFLPQNTFSAFQHKNPHLSSSSTVVWVVLLYNAEFKWTLIKARWPPSLEECFIHVCQKRILRFRSSGHRMVGHFVPLKWTRAQRRYRCWSAASGSGLDRSSSFVQRSVSWEFGVNCRIKYCLCGLFSIEYGLWVFCKWSHAVSI